LASALATPNGIALLKVERRVLNFFAQLLDFWSGSAND